MTGAGAQLQMRIDPHAATYRGRTLHRKRSVNVLPDARREREAPQRPHINGHVARTVVALMIAEIVAHNRIAIELGAIVELDVFVERLAAAQRAYVALQGVVIRVDFGLIAQ